MMSRRSECKTHDIEIYHELILPGTSMPSMVSRVVDLVLFYG